MNRTLLSCAVAAVLLSAGAASGDDPYAGAQGPARNNRHGKRYTPEPTQFTTSRNKSDKLKRLLRK